MGEKRKIHDDDDDTDYKPGRKTTKASAHKTRKGRTRGPPHPPATTRYKRQQCLSEFSPPMIPSLSLPVPPPLRPLPISHSSHPSLTAIDFLKAHRRVRESIYHYFLVPPSECITFANSDSSSRAIHVHPEFQPNILYLNWQIYREARQVLYGKNTFIASDPSRLFLPHGIRGLRRTTTMYIQHLAFQKSGPIFSLVMESSNTVYEPIWDMMVEHPAFLSLKKVTIHREAIRPADFGVMAMHTYLDSHHSGIGSDVIVNKKPLVIHAAAKLAYCAAMRDSEFHGLYISRKEELEYRTPQQFLAGNIIEVCLTRGDKIATPANLLLHNTVCEALWTEREAEIEGAAEAYQNYLDRCREVLRSGG